MSEHLHAAQPLACGIAALPSLVSAFASTQAAWRFFRNPNVSLPTLADPLHAAAHTALALSTHSFALVLHDWSKLNYHSHQSKSDQIIFSTDSDRGYELASALLIDADQGQPLAPLELRLRTKRHVYSTRQPAPGPQATHLDQIYPTLQSLRGLQLPKTLVHIIDCEADSIYHLRRWHKYHHLFVVRSDGTRWARWGKQEYRLQEIAATLQQQGQFTYARQVNYQGHSAGQYVAETQVVLTRPACLNRKGKRRKVKGKPLALRLVLSRVYDADGTLLAQWYLLSNVPAEMDAVEICLWYYWRWRVESYYKLLKSAGFQLESWQQEKAEALAKRLLVASMAAVVVWRVARLPGESGENLRTLLVRLSGHQVPRSKGYTLPALLAGMWVLLAMVELLKHYDIQEIQTLADMAYPEPTQSQSQKGRCIHDSS